MKISVVFAGSVSSSQKKALLRVVKRAKTEDDISRYTRPRGIWMLVNAYHKTIIFYR